MGSGGGHGTPRRPPPAGASGAAPVLGRRQEWRDPHVDMAIERFFAPWEKTLKRALKYSSERVDSLLGVLRNA
jgi:hypothetical protein